MLRKEHKTSVTLKVITNGRLAITHHFTEQAKGVQGGCDWESRVGVTGQYFFLVHLCENRGIEGDGVVECIQGANPPQIGMMGVPIDN